MRNAERTVGDGLPQGVHVRRAGNCKEGSSEDLAPDSPEPRSRSIIRFFSLAKKTAVPASYPTGLSSPTTGGGYSNFDSSSVSLLSLHRQRLSRAHHHYPRQRLTASFSSSSIRWSISSGSPLAGTRKLQHRPSASQISCTIMVSSGARSRRRLSRCGAGSALGSKGMIVKVERIFVVTIR